MKAKESSSRRPATSVHRTTARSSRPRTLRAEDQFESILDATTEFCGVWNVPSGRMRIFGHGLQRLESSAVKSPHGHQFLEELIHPDDLAAFAVRLKKILAGKALRLNCKFRMRTRTGLYRWFEIRGKTIRADKHGAATDFAYSLHDIDGLWRQRKRLLARHRTLAALVHASHECISVVDPVDFRLLAFNQPFADLVFRAHGIRVREGMRAEDVAPERADEWNAFYREVLTQGRVSLDYRVPLLNLTHHIVAQCLVRDGHTYAIGVSGHDITAQTQTEEALRKSEEKFSKAFLDAPLALTLTSTRDHRYIEVNDAYTESTGYTREEVIGKTPFDIGLWVQPEKRTEIVEQVLSNGEVRNAEFLFRTKSGEIREAVASAALIEINHEPCLLSVINDVTDRKRAVRALQESEERLRIAIDSGHMYTFEWDVATDFVQRSKQSIATLGLQDPVSRNTKKELIDRVHPEDKPNYVRALNSITAEVPGYKVVFRLPRRNGHTVWLEESGIGIFGLDGKLLKVIGITSDVTEVRESERTLRELSRRLITSQEEERRRVARELHDHIGQEAALICIQAQRIDSGVADQENTTHSDVHELYRKIKVLSGDISKLSHRLHSSELNFLGLAVAAERLCRDFASQFAVDVDYQSRPLPANLDGTRSIAFYRVLQEALQNVAKHSHASQVIVELQTIQNELVLKVKDNGCGFDLDKAGYESGLGLLSMQERMNLIGGHFSIASSQGKGTIVTASLTF